ncbi:Csu type fimbrial protein [Achromobacter insuavis]|uniref:Csu type fimbrial protein n=1 Tax=Achromobacter insuavis TaxID=1287735 RepID=UPI000A62BCEF|nr:spore coat protein U domain-containing protein [Achromobacter insuavis]
MRIKLRSLLSFFVLMAGLVAGVHATENCQGGTGSVNFGSFYSWQLYASQNARQFDSNFQCNFFSLINLGSNSELKVTAQSANNGAMTSLLVARLPYKLYSDAKGTVNLPFGQQVNLPQGGWSFLGGSVGGSIQLFLETQAGATPIATTYTDIITLTWQWGYCSFGSFLGCPSWFWHSGTSVTTVNVSIDVRKSCAFNGASATLNFGAQPLVSMFKPSTANVGIYCTLLAPFKLSIGDGENAASGMRRMKGPGNNYIEYQLYQSGTDTVIPAGTPMTGTGLGSIQTIAIEGRINTKQADVPVGEYIDRPIMVIEY